MLGRTHLLFGLVLGFFAVKELALPSTVVVFVLLGSLFPDLDHPSSLISCFNFVLKDVSKAVKKVIGHRTYLHTLEAGFLISFLIAPVSSYFGFNATLNAIGFFTGFAGHLFLDSLTRSGVPLTFSGVNRHKKRGLRLLRTGSIEEHWFSVVLFLLLVTLFL